MADYKCWGSDNIIIIDSYEEEKRRTPKEKMETYRKVFKQLGFPNDMLGDGRSWHWWKVLKAHDCCNCFLWGLLINGTPPFYIFTHLLTVENLWFKALTLAVSSFITYHQLGSTTLLCYKWWLVCLKNGAGVTNPSYFSRAIFMVVVT